MKGSILIVDDEATLVEAIRDHFAAEGLDAACAASGEEALERMQARRFDVVVTDLKMPGMSGLDLLRTLKTSPEPPAVILMTAYGTTETAVEAFRLGLFDLLPKPVSLDELSRSVERAFEARAALAGPAGAPMPLHVLRERSRRVGAVRAEVAGDPSSPQATAVWRFRALDRERVGFVWAHVAPDSRFALAARFVLRALADTVDVRTPAHGLATIVRQLEDLDCGGALRAIAVGVFEPKPQRRFHGAAFGGAGVFRFAHGDAAVECLTDAPRGSTCTWETSLGVEDVILLADARLVSAPERWREVLARTAQLVAQGEPSPARRTLAMVPELASESPVAVALRLGEAIQPDGPVHVRVSSNQASLAHVRDVAEQFALGSPLSECAARELVTAVQEAVLNCFRWAYVGREGPVCVTFSRERGRVRASVRDHGLGFDVGETFGRAADPSQDPLRRSGRGLRLMHGLADQFELVSRPGRGTNVVLEKCFDATLADGEPHEAEQLR
jgi:CheY-like chemotaxis protein